LKCSGKHVEISDNHSTSRPFISLVSTYLYPSIYIHIHVLNLRNLRKQNSTSIIRPSDPSVHPPTDLPTNQTYTTVHPSIHSSIHLVQYNYTCTYYRPIRPRTFRCPGFRTVFSKQLAGLPGGGIGPPQGIYLDRTQIQKNARDTISNYF
jgi:hypothetical protein